MSWAQEPWYNTEGDISTAVGFIDELRRYLETSSTLQLMASQRNQTSKDLVLGAYGTGLHFAGSAVIGEENDGLSMVDLNTKVRWKYRGDFRAFDGRLVTVLQVWGTQNMFIADASFHANVLTGNIQVIIACTSKVK